MAQTDQTEIAESKFPVSPLAGVLIVVLIFYGSGEVGKIVIGIIAALFKLSDGPYVQFAYTFFVYALTLVLLLMVMRATKVTVGAIGLIKPQLVNIAAFIAGYASYFILNLVAIGSATVLFHLDTEQQQQLGFNTVQSTPQLVVTFISLVILPPLVEELVMRGFLFSSLKRGMPVVAAALLTSLLFGFAHLELGQGAPPLWSAAIDTFVLSLVLCTLRQKTGNLWAGIGVHMFKNGLAFAVLYIFPHAANRL